MLHFWWRNDWLRVQPDNNPLIRGKMWMEWRKKATKIPSKWVLQWGMSAIQDPGMQSHSWPAEYQAGIMGLDWDDSREGMERCGQGTVKVTTGLYRLHIEHGLYWGSCSGNRRVKGSVCIFFQGSWEAVEVGIALRAQWRGHGSRQVTDTGFVERKVRILGDRQTQGISTAINWNLLLGQMWVKRTMERLSDFANSRTVSPCTRGPLGPPLTNAASCCETCFV